MFAGSALVAAIAWWGCRSTQNVRVRAKLFRVLDSALFLFVVIATSGLAAQVIKHIIGRARPKVGPSAFSFDPLSVDNGFASLPSGHATSAFRGRHSPRADGRSGSRGAGRSRGGRRCFSGGLAGALSERRRHRCGTRGDGRFGVSRAPRSSATIQSLHARLVRPFDPDQLQGLLEFQGLLERCGHDWSPPLPVPPVVPSFPPALIARLFAIAVPPADLFGSEMIEHIKDSCAIVIALAGLTVRRLVVGSGQAPEPRRTRSFHAV